MEEEELIKKLESIKLPQIEIESHRRRLRTALLNSEYFKEQQRVGVFTQAKSKMKGLFSWRPVRKPALVSALALALIISSVLFVPSLFGPSPEVLAADIAQNSPQVRAALGSGEVQAVEVIKVVDDKGTVVCKGELGIIIAEVDLKNKVVTEVVTIPQLTTADKQKAIDIAKADSRVKELLDKGASIGNVSSMYSFGARINAETGETEEFFETLVTVAMELGEKSWAAYVDLTEEKVVRLEETTPGARESYSGVEGESRVLWGAQQKREQRRRMN